MRRGVRRSACRIRMMEIERERGISSPDAYEFDLSGSPDAAVRRAQIQRRHLRTLFASMAWCGGSTTQGHRVATQVFESAAARLPVLRLSTSDLRAAIRSTARRLERVLAVSGAMTGRSAAANASAASTICRTACKPVPSQTAPSGTGQRRRATIRSQRVVVRMTGSILVDKPRWSPGGTTRHRPSRRPPHDGVLGQRALDSASSRFCTP